MTAPTLHPGYHVSYFRGIRKAPINQNSAPTFTGDLVEAIIDVVNDDGTVNLRYPHHLDGEYQVNRVLTPETVMATADRVQEGTGAFMWARLQFEGAQALADDYSAATDAALGYAAALQRPEEQP